MNEPEVVKLMTVIQNAYNFTFDRLKVGLWGDLLKNVPVNLAEINLRRYIMDPANKFPPHPGVLAEKPSQKCEGNYVPDAMETRLMLEERDRLLIGSSGSTDIPESARERMRQLGYESSSRRPE